MKQKLILPLLLVFSGVVSAQDTIFIKTGEKIPAVILERNNVEIKYRKFGQQGDAIYSVFVSDISGIHFKSGIIADYSQVGQTTESKPETAIDLAGTMKTIRLSFGFGTEFFSRNTSDDFSAYWKYRTGNHSANINGNLISIPVILRGTFTAGQSGRNWFGDDFRFFIMPSPYLSSTENNGASSISLREFYTSIMVFYGRTLNHRKNVAAILEAGVDFSFGLKGNIVFYDKVNKVMDVGGVGPHIALGGDWIITKRVTLCGRIGYRFFKTKRIEYFNGPSDWGYFPGISRNGLYSTIGLTWNFYLKLPGFKTRT